MMRIACLLSAVLLAECAIAQVGPHELRIDRPPVLDPLSYEIIDIAPLAISGDTVHAAWVDNRLSPSSSSPEHDVFYNRSTDGGRTWQPTDTQLNIGAAFADDVSIAVDGLNVYVIWREGGSIYCNRSIDGGVTWLANPGLVGLSVRPPTITIVNGAVIVAWTGIILSQPDFYVLTSRSTDQGLTWSPALQLTINSNSAVPTVALAASGTSVYAAWTDSFDTYCTFSHDSGATWQATASRVSTDPIGMLAVTDANVVAAGNSVFVVWNDERSSVPPYTFGGVYCNFSNDGGATWQPAETELDAGPGNGLYSRNIDIAATTNAVHVSWSDELTSGGDVPALRSSYDGGASWIAPPPSLWTGITSAEPSLAADGSTLTIANLETSGALSALYSSDEGVSWGMPAPYASAGAIGPAYATCGSHRIHVVWRDLLSTNPTVQGVLTNRVFGAESHGTGTQGSGAITPTLFASGPARAGHTLTLELTDTVGGALSAILIGFGPDKQVSLPLFGGELLVAPTTTIGISMPGTPGTPGIGATSLPLLVPTSAGIQGLNVNFQAIIVDPGGAGGFAMTAAEYVWLG